MHVSKKLACGMLAAGAPLATAGALALASSPAAASSAGGLPVLTLKMNGKSIKVSGKTVSGAVTVRSIVSKEKAAEPVLVRLNQGVTLAQFAKAFKGAAKDPNTASLVGAIVFDADAGPGTSNVQTVLPTSAGASKTTYVAIDLAGKGAPRIAPFTVTKSSSPAKLPKAAATTRSIEFAFRGASTLKVGTMVRGVNDGWLVHMNDFQGVKSKKDGMKAIAGLRKGTPTRKLAKYLNSSFFSVFEPVSHGATQQTVLQAKPGYYVEVCFMTTQDGRAHTQLGMERLVKVVK